MWDALDMPSRYDKSCLLCGTEVMKKGDVTKDFSTMTFGNKKSVVCNECKTKGKTAFL